VGILEKMERLVVEVPMIDTTTVVTILVMWFLSVVTYYIGVRTGKGLIIIEHQKGEETKYEYAAPPSDIMKRFSPAARRMVRKAKPVPEPPRLRPEPRPDPLFEEQEEQRIQKLAKEM
jgi:hypothetical protein